MPSRTLTIEIKILEVKFSFTANTKLVCRKGVLVISTLLASSVCWVNDVAFGCYIYFLSPLRVQKTTPQFAKFNFPFVNPISSGKGSVPFWFFFLFAEVKPPERQLLCFQGGAWGCEGITFPCPYMCTSYPLKLHRNQALTDIPGLFQWYVVFPGSVQKLQ